MAGQEAENQGVEDALRGLTMSFGVTSYVILNKTGLPVQYHGMSDKKAIQAAALFSEMALSSQNFLDKKYLEPMSEEAPELLCLRIRTVKHEFVVCPGENFTLIVVHDPNYIEPPFVAAVEGDGEEDEGDGTPGTARE